MNPREWNTKQRTIVVAVAALYIYFLTLYSSRGDATIDFPTWAFVSLVLTVAVVVAFDLLIRVIRWVLAGRDNDW